MHALSIPNNLNECKKIEYQKMYTILCQKTKYKKFSLHKILSTYTVFNPCNTNFDLFLTINVSTILYAISYSLY